MLKTGREIAIEEFGVNPEDKWALKRRIRMLRLWALRDPRIGKKLGGKFFFFREYFQQPKQAVKKEQVAPFFRT